MAELPYLQCSLILWCDTIDRKPYGWRALKKNLTHSISTTHEDCPDEELVPCPAKRCGGFCRARPVGWLIVQKGKKKLPATRNKT